MYCCIAYKLLKLFRCAVKNNTYVMLYFIALQTRTNSFRYPLKRQRITYVHCIALTKLNPLCSGDNTWQLLLYTIAYKYYFLWALKRKCCTAKHTRTIALYSVITLCREINICDVAWQCIQEHTIYCKN